MDTEQQIAERLKQNIRREDPAPNPSEIPAAPSAPEETGFVNDIGDNINLYKLYDYFNVDPAYRNGENEQKIQYIYRWAANIAQSTDYIAVAQVLTSYSFGMGAGELGSKNLDRMYQYIKLDNQIQGLRQEQGLLYG